MELIVTNKPDYFPQNTGLSGYVGSDRLKEPDETSARHGRSLVHPATVSPSLAARTTLLANGGKLNGRCLLARHAAAVAEAAVRLTRRHGNPTRASRVATVPPCHLHTSARAIIMQAAMSALHPKRP
jgi:hypothetical protein